MPLLTQRDPRGVVTLTLNRPERHNALDAALIAALTQAARAAATDASVRAVVLTGAGPSFCAGADLGWMRAQVEADRAGRIAQARSLADLLGALWGLPQPLIARIQGPAYGGGVGLIATADHAIAHESARFGLTETRLGLIPATISPYVAARLGPRAGEILAWPGLFDPAEAIRLGLIARATADLDTAITAQLAPYLTAAPGAVAAAKALGRRLGPALDAATLTASIEALADRWESAEAAAGIDAFFAKRPAPWT